MVSAMRQQPARIIFARGILFGLALDPRQSTQTDNDNPA
jgi:hypothetical protein